MGILYFVANRPYYLITLKPYWSAASLPKSHPIAAFFSNLSKAMTPFRKAPNVSVQFLVLIFGILSEIRELWWEPCRTGRPDWKFSDKNSAPRASAREVRCVSKLRCTVFEKLVFLYCDEAQWCRANASRNYVFWGHWYAICWSYKRTWMDGRRTVVFGKVVFYDDIPKFRGVAI